MPLEDKNGGVFKLESESTKISGSSTRTAASQSENSQEAKLFKFLNQFIVLVSNDGVGETGERSKVNDKYISNYLRLNLLSYLRQLQQYPRRVGSHREALIQWWVTLLNFLNSDLVSDEIRSQNPSGPVLSFPDPFLSIETVSVCLECVSRLMSSLMILPMHDVQQTETFSHHILLTIHFVTNRLILNSKHTRQLTDSQGSPTEFVSKFQQIGAGVYFNPFANINGHDVKYGVVSMETLLKDIATWNTFYLAGRLQKPVKILKNDLRVQYWNQLNLKAAATLAKHYTLEKNNNKFDEFQFYKEITALSYAGDIRYKLGGENPDKVNNIVTKNFERFQEYYKPIYKEVVLNDSFYLPKGFTLKNTQRLLLSRISKSSALQTIKGVFTAGITKSIKYAWAKKLKSMRRS